MAIVRTNINLTAVTYAAGEDIIIRNGATLTVSATPTVRPGNIICNTSGRLLVFNSSPTVPLILELSDFTKDFVFSADGKFQVAGLYGGIVLGTSTGASQVLSVAALGYNDLTYIEAERVAGSGLFFPLPLVVSDARFYNVGRTIHRGCIASDFSIDHVVALYDQSAGTVTIGANGAFLPVGVSIRVPNILIGNRDSNNMAASTTHTLLTEGVPTGGNFTITVKRPRLGTTLGTTTALAFNATAASIDTALEAIIGAGTITSSGGALPSAVNLVLAGAFATEPLEFLVNSSLTGGVNSIAYTRETSEANFTLVNLNLGGDLQAESCMFAHNIRPTASQGGKFLMSQSGCGPGSLALTSTVAPMTFENAHIGFNPYGSPNQHTFTTMLGENSLTGTTFIGGSAFGAVIFNSCVIASGNGVSVFMPIPRTNAAGYALQHNASVFKSVVKDLKVVGGRVLFNLANNLTLVNIKTADRTNGIKSTAVGQPALQFTACSNVLINGFSSIGLAAARNQVIITDANCTGFRVFNVTYNCNTNTLGGINYPSVNGEFYNVTLENTPSNFQPILGSSAYASKTPSGYKILTRLSGTFQNPLPSSGSKYDLVAASSFIQTYPTTSVGLEDYVGGNFTTAPLTSTLPTSGFLTFGPLAPGLGLEVTGAAFPDGGGAVVLLEPLDSLTASLDFPLRGITSFTGAGYLTGRFQGVSASGAVHTIINPGILTGGTFTVSLYNGTTLVGTTPPLAVTTTTAAALQAALRAIPGANAALTVTGANLAVGFTVNPFDKRGFTCDGALTTGGSLPGLVDSYATVTGVPLVDLGPRYALTFSIKAPTETLWPTHLPLNSANLTATVLPSAATGLTMQIKLATLPGFSSAEGTLIRAIGLDTVLNTTLVTNPDSFINIQGLNLLDGDTAEMRNLSDDSLVATFNTNGVSNFEVGSNLDVSVYFLRKLGTVTLVNTFTQPLRLKYGDNGTQNLFFGNQLQVAVTTVTSGGGGSTDLTPVLSAVASVDSKVVATQGLVTGVGTQVSTVKADTVAIQSGVSSVIAATDTLEGSMNTLLTNTAFIVGRLPIDTEVLRSLAVSNSNNVATLNNTVLGIPLEVLNSTVESSTTVRQSLRLANAVLGGVTTGAGTGTETFKSQDGSTDRIVATVNTVTGERTSITKDL